ncbi:unnamed protein product [Rotaria sp. Silwood1]|nr:unnamed protein product [Rotaria sp. Silwood1]
MATLSLTIKTVPLFPQQLIQERSLSDGSIKILKTSTDDPLLLIKTSTLISIPLNSSISLNDPRLKTFKQTRNLFYLELQAVKHALQQQKRLNHYYDLKNGLTPKASYTVISYIIRQVSNDEYERLLKPKTYNQMYIDFEQNENRLAYEQIEIKIQQQLNEKQYSNKSSSLINPLLSNTKLHITNGRQLLKERKLLISTPNTNISSDILDFFSREYRNANRSHVKHILAKLVGIFIEKYHIKNNETVENIVENHHSIQESITDDQTINCVVDMDLDSRSSQRLCDHDERFRIPAPPSTPPPPSLPQLSQITLSSISSTNENIYAQSFSSIFILTPPLPNEPNKIFDDENYNDQILLSNLLITTKAESIIPSEETILKTCLGQFESLSSSSPSSENSSIVDDNHSLNINNNNNDLQKENNTNLTSIEDDSTRSRDEFVKLLTKQAYISKSSSPVKIQNNRKRSYDYHHHERRRSHNDDHEMKNSSSSYSSNYHQLILVSNCAHENQDNKQNIDNQIDQQEEVEDEEPTVKRIKVDHSISPSSSSDRTNQDENLNEKDLSLKSIVTIPTITNNHEIIDIILMKNDENEYRHESRRSSDSSNNYHYKRYSNQLSDRYEIFNETFYRNSLLTAYHQHNIEDLIQTNNLHKFSTTITSTS